jgi:RNA polymerase sigma-70 factor, ECF subfamily
MKSDAEMLLLLKEGDEKTFEFIFNKYYDGLCSFSRTITKNHEASEEIVEELFLQFWLNCKMNLIKTSIKSYLFQGAYNNSIKYISRLKKNVISIDDSNQIGIELSVPELPIGKLIAEELEEKAIKAIESLPEKCRQIYLMNRNEDLKYQEIAERLKISVGTVKTQMSRAFSKLREELNEFLTVFF